MKQRIIDWWYGLHIRTRNFFEYWLMFVLGATCITLVICFFVLCGNLLSLLPRWAIIPVIVVVFAGLMAAFAAADEDL